MSLIPIDPAIFIRSLSEMLISTPRNITICTNWTSGSNEVTEFSVSKARDTLSEIVNRVAYRGERVVLNRHGKPVAALVSAADLKRLSEFEKAKSKTRARQRGR